MVRGGHRRQVDKLKRLLARAPPSDGRAQLLKNGLRMCFVLRRVRQAIKTRDCFRRIAFRDWFAPLKHDLDQSDHRITGHASRFVERLAISREARKCGAGDRIAALVSWVKNVGVGSCHISTIASHFSLVSIIEQKSNDQTFQNKATVTAYLAAARFGPTAFTLTLAQDTVNGFGGDIINAPLDGSSVIRLDVPSATSTSAT